MREGEDKHVSHQRPQVYETHANPPHTQLTLSDLLDHAIPALAGKDLGVLDDAPVELEDGGGGGRGGKRGGWRHGISGKDGLAGLVLGGVDERAQGGGEVFGVAGSCVCVCLWFVRSTG